MRKNDEPCMTIYLLDKQYVEIQSIPRTDIMDFVEEFKDGDEQIFAFDLGEGKNESLVLVRRQAISYVDVAWTPGLWARIKMFISRTRDDWSH